MQKRIPVGVDDFQILRESNFYFVDKTGLIIDLLKNMGYVNLITRPRRFGKTINMTMLATFFSPFTDKSVFNGLRITQEKKLCEAYMGQFPTIFISLKSVEGSTYDNAFAQLKFEIRNAAIEIDRQVAGSTSIHPSYLEELKRLTRYDIEEIDVINSLYILTNILHVHYGKRAILLIDEYDAPLASANSHGYYDKMIVVIRSMFHKALKTNKHLNLAVLTGCLRIAKESIFTGLNNLRVLPTHDPLFAEYFGFTDEDVRNMLGYYSLDDKYQLTKDWYDGYKFGNINIYCPWDVISYCDVLQRLPNSAPQNFWINSSSRGTEAVMKFISNGDESVRQDIETLINGGVIQKKLHQELTYQDIYSSVDNIWSLLYATGYLTCTRIDNNYFSLVIPNQEVRSIFTDQIIKMFDESLDCDPAALKKFCNALYNGDVSEAELQLNKYLMRTISVRDPASSGKDWRESFFQALLLGILSRHQSGWDIRSNWETGNGYCDIIVLIEQTREAMLIEVKYAHMGNLELACRKAIDQIIEKRYTEGMHSKGYKTVRAYGMAFHGKDCKIMPAL